MNCTVIQRRLDAYLHNELGPEENGRIATHLATCATCRAELEAWRALSLLLSDTQLGPLPPDFTQQVLRRIEDETEGHLLWPWLRRRWSVHQFVSMAYAVGTTAAAAALSVLVLRYGLIAEVGEQAQTHLVNARVSVEITGAWLSQLWQSLLAPLN